MNMLIHDAFFFRILFHFNFFRQQYLTQLD